MGAREFRADSAQVRPFEARPPEPDAGPARARLGGHYNRTKAHPSSRPGNDHKSPGHQKVDREFRTTSEKLAADYGVSDLTIQRAGKFAAAVETLRAVDPEIEAKVVTGAFVGFVGAYPGGFSKIEGSPTARSGRYHGARDEWCPRLPGGAEEVEIPPLSLA